MEPNLIGQRYELLAPILSERQRRLWAGAEARVLGWGGIERVARDGVVARGGVGGAPGTGLWPHEGMAASGPAAGWGPPAGDGAGSDAESRLGAAGRADQPRGARLTVALDLQEHPPTGGGPAPTRPPRQPHGGRGTAPRTGL